MINANVALSQRRVNMPIAFSSFIGMIMQVIAQWKRRLMYNDHFSTASFKGESATCIHDVQRAVGAP